MMRVPRLPHMASRRSCARADAQGDAKRGESERRISGGRTCGRVRMRQSPRERYARACVHRHRRPPPAARHLRPPAATARLCVCVCARARACPSLRARARVWLRARAPRATPLCWACNPRGRPLA
eukprot:6404643-Prymnesium_polylepis.2